MSIVLVILGLLVASVVTSTGMIGQAKIRAVVSEITNLRVAVESFRGAYNLQLPGDISNAYDFWPGECGANSTGPAGCNGNGNQYIGFDNHESGVVESYRFWQHLSLSKMFDYNATGVVNASAPLTNAENMYESGSLEGAIYWPQFAYDWGAGQFYSNDIKNSNFFILGRPHATLETPVDKAISPASAYNIDIKIDDSKPRTGKIKAYNYNDSTNGWEGTTSTYASGTECTSVGAVNRTDNELVDAVYTIALESEECILFIDF